MARFGVDLAEWREILLAVLATRAVLIAVGVLAWTFMPRGASFLNLVPDLELLSMWVQWDAEHYIVVAVEGYSYAPGAYSNTAFFPLFPWLVHLGSAVLGRVDVPTASAVGLVVANVSLFVALMYLAALVARDLGRAAARRSVLYVLLFPTTVFLSAPYAEPLFLATAVGSLYHARRGEWYRAGVAGGLAALTRPFGILLVIPIAIELYRQRARPWALPSLALVPAGTALFFGFLQWRFGDPWLYVRANEVWGRHVAPPWEPLLEFLTADVVVFGWYHSLVDLSFVAGMVIVAVVAWRRLPPSYAALGSAGLLFALSTSVWISTPRHAVALFPLIVAMAVYGERRDFHWPWLVLSSVLSLGIAARYFSGNWTA